MKRIDEVSLYCAWGDAQASSVDAPRRTMAVGNSVAHLGWTRWWQRLSRNAGDTLLEVLVALLVLALAALGTVALQSWFARSLQAARWLDLAVSASSQVAEALRAGEAAAASIDLANRTVQALPDGQLSLTALGASQARLSVSWSEPPRWGVPTAPEGGASMAACPEAAQLAGSGREPRCVFVGLLQ